MKKIILHLCADIGSDSRAYQLDDKYKVIKIGIDVGIENFSPYGEIHGIIANPVCTEFSTANHNIDRCHKTGMFLVDHCLRIIKEANPEWWMIENPATGTLKQHLGKPDFVYQPYEFGSPWTKRTALWGEFNNPDKLYTNWEDVPKNQNLYVRPGRPKPSLAFLHKSAIQFMPEFSWCKDKIHCDSDLRSLCAPGFSQQFKKANP